MTGGGRRGGRGGRAALPPSPRPRVPALPAASVRKIREDEDGARRWRRQRRRGCSLLLPPTSPPPLSAIHSSGSRGVMIYHCPSARGVAGRGFDARGPAELFFSRNRYEPTTILSHPHRSPTVEVALAAAKVAAGVVVDGGRNEGIHRRSRSESNSSGESRGCSRTKADGG